VLFFINTCTAAVAIVGNDFILFKIPHFDNFFLFIFIQFHLEEEKAAHL
jgi:hypothetical protein